MPAADRGIRWEDRAASTGSLEGILHDVRAFVHRYVVLSSEQATAIALWIAHTHAFDAADTTPYLQVTSATFGSGKTRLLEIAEPLVKDPWFTSRTSAAALVRKVDSDHPTLLLDESDTALKSDREYAAALTGILNAGYKRNGTASLCVGKSSNIGVKDFGVFCPKALAGIGELPDTVASRSIPIVLKRKLASESVQRWRLRDGREEAEPLRLRLLAWSEEAIEPLRRARPDIPLDLSDRAADVWEPLIAIADLAGGDWGTRARRAAVTMMRGRAFSDPAIDLLRDLRDEVLAEETESIVPTKAILDKLTALDDRPWATFSQGRVMTSRALSVLLGRFQVSPVRLERFRGYCRDALEGLIFRYLPDEASERQTLNEYGPELPDARGVLDVPEDPTRQPISPTKTGFADALTFQVAGTRAQEDTDERI
jgi:hypothetical protein